MRVKPTVGVIGAGFVGLTASLRLAQKGYRVVVFEKADFPGGLAGGFKDKNWSWILEMHYHHLFTSDSAILNLAREVNHKIIFKRPKTSTFYHGKIFQIDSLGALMRFPYLDFISKIRTGLTLGLMRATSFWKIFEKFTAHQFILTMTGTISWDVLWKRLFEGKFGIYSNKVSAAWFWARIKKRSAVLGYPEKGFQALSNTVALSAQNSGVKFNFGQGVSKIRRVGEKLELTTNNRKSHLFDRIICTLPAGILANTTENLPLHYREKLALLEGVGAINLVLSLKKKFLPNDTYWLNITDSGYPFLCIVEHTNFMSSSAYGGSNLVYVGNYLPSTHLYFSKDENELLREFFPYLKKISPYFSKKYINKVWVFKAPFAQPIFPLNYSKKILPHKTPIKGLYLANMQQVYPWDRGTNYAVELGEKIANIVEKDDAKIF